MNKTTYFKYSLRFAKEKGIFNEFKKAILAIKHPTKQEERNLQEYPYRESKILIFFERMFVNKLNIQTGRYFNDYTIFLHKSIGEDKSFEIFKSYIINKYGNDVFELFLNNVKPSYIKRTAGQDFVKTYIPYLKKMQYYDEISNEDKIKMLKQLPVTGYIMCTFDWQSTKQGHAYWRNIYYKWIKYYEKNIMLT